MCWNGPSRHFGRNSGFSFLLLQEEIPSWHLWWPLAFGWSWKPTTQQTSTKVVITATTPHISAGLTFSAEFPSVHRESAASSDQKLTPLATSRLRVESQTDSLKFKHERLGQITGPELWKKTTAAQLKCSGFGYQLVRRTGLAAGIVDAGLNLP